MGGKIFSFIYIAITSILLVGGFTVLYKVYNYLYGEELWNSLDPIYCHKNISYKSSEYLLIGDSRIVQWEIPETIIQSNQLLNFGIDSQTTGQILQRAKDYLENYHTRYVLIQGGINDLKTIGFYPERAEYITSLTIKNFELLLALCLKHNTMPIFVTIIPPGNVELKRIIFWNKKINESVKEVNKALVEYCKNLNIKVLDASKLLSDDGLFVRKEYERGCLHLNEKGYKHLNSELEKILKKQTSY